MVGSSSPIVIYRILLCACLQTALKAQYTSTRIQMSRKQSKKVEYDRLGITLCNMASAKPGTVFQKPFVEKLGP